MTVPPCKIAADVMTVHAYRRKPGFIAVILFGYPYRTDPAESSVRKFNTDIITVFFCYLKFSEDSEEYRKHRCKRYP